MPGWLFICIKHMSLMDGTLGGTFGVSFKKRLAEPEPGTFENHLEDGRSN